MNNSEARKELIKICGAKCFIEELGLRTKEEVESELRLYGKGQRQVMDTLTYHHIVDRCKGGQTSLENGAVLRNINHRWFNRLSPKQQEEINKLFIEYKKQFYKECKVEAVEGIDLGFSARGIILTLEEQKELHREIIEEIRY